MPRLVHRAPKVLVPLRLDAAVVQWADLFAEEAGVSRIEALRAMCRVATRSRGRAEVRAELILTATPPSEAPAKTNTGAGTAR